MLGDIWYQHSSAVQEDGVSVNMRQFESIERQRSQRWQLIQRDDSGLGLVWSVQFSLNWGCIYLLKASSAVFQRKLDHNVRQVLSLELELPQRTLGLM